MRNIYNSFVKVVHRCSRLVPNSHCVFCGQSSTTLICRWCNDDIAFFPLPPANLLLRPNIRHQLVRPKYQGLYALGWYEWPFSQCIKQLKFNQRMMMGRVLAAWFSARQRAIPQPLPELLLPVPTSHVSRFNRYVNQAAFLAHQIGQQLDIPVCETWASKPWVTRRFQHRANRRERLAKRHHFQLNTDIKASRVAIVDDVITTGSTVNSLVKLLQKKYPTLCIDVWVMAITPPPNTKGHTSTS